MKNLEQIKNLHCNFYMKAQGWHLFPTLLNEDKFVKLSIWDFCFLEYCCFLILLNKVNVDFLCRYYFMPT